MEISGNEGGARQIGSGRKAKLGVERLMPCGREGDEESVVMQQWGVVEEMNEASAHGDHFVVDYHWHDRRL